MEEDLSRIEDALDVLERTEETEDAIDSLPDTVNPDDTKAEEQIQAAKDKYDALTDYEKSLISDEAKEKLEGLLVALCDYRIIEGNGSTWTVGDAGSVTMTANGPVAKFIGIEVDGKTVDPANYTVKSGSTIITLNPEYLRTLSVCKHTLTVLYTDGEASGAFEIVKGAEGTTTIPQTGAGSNAALWMTLMLLTTCGLTGMVYRRKKKYSK